MKRISASKSRSCLAAFIVLAAALLLTNLLSPPAFSQLDISTRIKKVENNLLPPALVKDGPRWNIHERMAFYKVPGISVAVINDFKVEWAKGYGVLDTETRAPVTGHSLFQAASISKPVTAAVALKMVQDGALSLDADINSALKSWKLPDNKFTAQVKVTLKHLLSHTGGVTVSGFPGYNPSGPIPTLLQILNGEPPANTAPIRVDILPGKQWRYAGGGYTILQQMLIEVSGKPFPALMKEAILDPLGMVDSAFEQPLPASKLASAAAGHLPRNRFVDGKRHSYPELAAAGLWTTPTDLARFAVELQLALQGRSNKILSQASVERMLTPVQANYGLGFGIDPRGYFQHSGGNAGFTCLLFAHKKSGYGAVVMTNSSNGPSLFNEIMRSIAQEYHWDNYLPAEQSPIVLSAAQEEAVLGRYAFAGDETASVVKDNGVLLIDGFDDEKIRLIPLSEMIFVSIEKGIRLVFDKDKRGRAASFNVSGQVAQAQRWERATDLKTTPYELLREEKTAEALEAYRRVFMEFPGRLMVAEARLNNLGYRLLEKGKSADALTILSLAVEFYPRSANACDSLAEAYEASGNKEKAVQYYQKVMEVAPLDPRPDKAALENLKTNALNKIKELGGKK